MDDCLDPYLSSLSWLQDEPDEPSILIPNPLGLYQDEPKIPLSSSITSLNQPVGCLAAQDTPSTVDSEGTIDDGFLSMDAEQQTDSQNCSSNNNSINEILNGYNSVPMNFCGDMRTSISFPEIGGHNGVDSAKFRRSLPDLQNLSPNPQMLWPSASSSTLMLHNGHTESYVEMDKLLQPETKGKQEMRNCDIPSFTVLPETTMQNASVKPRARARRGQATDPHSIAERLRREKIADRMKSLQELVPNSNKTDKASMLDEIIEYVKFLQLQVKVLSMSRVGAAGAVAPLITENHPEGTNGLLLSHLSSQEAAFTPTPDEIAFEQEVVKLMESDLTMAMQFLQTKGLCLMPVALASAISKPSSLGIASGETKKFGLGKCGNSCGSSSNSSVSIGAQQNVKEEISNNFGTKS